MHRPRVGMRSGVQPCLAAGFVFCVLSAHAEEAPKDHEVLYYDALDATGALIGGKLLVPSVPPALLRAQPLAAASSASILLNGPPANRIDLVAVGDGYLASQLALYHMHAENGVANLLATEPFSTYQSFFNVHIVDVVSNESGVDNDPSLGIMRDTAMDMGFWCSGIERLLCVDVAKAYSFANNAPDVDHVLALANSTKYGGAGYTGSELATWSGGNGSATEVAIHELGHSLGTLADEYFSTGTYSGPEPVEPNVSILAAAAMASAGTKWSAWLGDPGNGFGGLVDTYEGAYYNMFGISRPTDNSKMRSLGQPFNLPSVEAFILEFYRIVDPIDSATLADTVGGTDALFVTPLHPTGHDLDVQWFLNGDPIAGANGEALALAALALAPGIHEVRVEVADNTSWVRDETQRAALMTASRSWVVRVETNTSAFVPGRATPGLAVLLVPNPIGTAVAIRFQLERESPVVVRVFDARGHRVRTLATRHVWPPGTHEVHWDARDESGHTAAAGTYVIQVLSGSEAAVSRAVLLR